MTKNLFLIKKDTPDATAAVKAAIDSFRDDCDNIIEFERGVYHFYAKGADRMFSYSSGGPRAEISVIFPLIGKKNVTVDGGGSEFIFCDRVQPFKIESCEGVTLKNFSVDFAFLRYAYADVCCTNEEGFGVKFDEELFKYSVEDGHVLFHCGAEKLSTGVRKISSKRMLPTKGGTFFLYVGDFSAEYNRAAPNVKVNAEKTDCGVFFRYRPENTAKPDFNAGDKVCLAYDNDREAQTCHCEFSKDITLKSVNIWRQGGMGFVADVCENITLDDFHIGLKEHRAEFFSTTADGIYLTNCKGYFNVLNCSVMNAYDDAMNVHGFYSKVDKMLPDEKVEIAYLHEHHWGLLPYCAGDTVYFSTPGDFMEIGSAKIESVSFDGDRKNIILTLSDTSKLKEGMLIENRSRMPKVHIEGSTFKNCPHIRLSAPEITVKNNVFELNATDLYVCDLIDFWGECGAVENMVITGNRFGAGCRHNIEILSCRPETSNHLHKRIVIENNTFANFEDVAIKASHVGELVIGENRFNTPLDN